MDIEENVRKIKQEAVVIRTILLFLIGLIVGFMFTSN